MGRRVAIVGAGPVGIEAAVYARRLGHDVTVYEAGRIGEHLLRWGHVRLFSPWRLNHSPLGARALEAEGVELPAPDALLTGAQLVACYLEPLTRIALGRRAHLGTRVLAVGRDGLGKSDGLAGGRERHPFRLLLDGPAGESVAFADVVIDASGTYGNPRWLGSGNLPALGERALRASIDYGLQDVAGARRSEFERRRVLVVGDGLSAATALDALLALDGVEVTWAARSARYAPYEEMADDPLPERRRLCALGNALARGTDPRVRFLPRAAVDAVARRDDGFVVSLRVGDAPRTIEVDRILAHVGYAPDASLYRELQVHECWATCGPMKLAAALLADSSTDCLAPTSAGRDTLSNPEPDFFLLGAKSYGLSSRFLLHVGLEQVRDVFALVEGRPGLDLYAG